MKTNKLKTNNPLNQSFKAIQTDPAELDGNRNPPEDVDTIKLPHPVNIYPHETKTK